MLAHRTEACAGAWCCRRLAHLLPAAADRRREAALHARTRASPAHGRARHPQARRSRQHHRLARQPAPVALRQARARHHLDRLHRHRRLPDARRRVRHPRQGGAALLQHLRRRLHALHAAPDHVGRRPALRHDHRPARLARLHPPAARFCHAPLRPDAASARGSSSPPTSRCRRRSPTPACSRGSRSRPSIPTTSIRASPASQPRQAGSMCRRGQRLPASARSRPGARACCRRCRSRSSSARPRARCMCATASGGCSRPPSRSPIPTGRSARTCSPRWSSRTTAPACAGYRCRCPPPRERSAQTRKVSRASRNESEPMLPRSSGPPVDGRRGARPLRAAQGGARPHLARCSRRAWSLIVSDHGHNREMRDNGTTDFVVLTR